MVRQSDKMRHINLKKKKKMRKERLTYINNIK